MANKKQDERKAQILELTNAFCDEKLNEEYSLLCKKLINKMGRKKDVPFKRGRIDIWAAAVVHAIGSVNFLFDKSFEPYASVSDINDYFGTKSSSVSQKSKRIMDLFKMTYFDSEFSTGGMNDVSPLNNMVVVDGYIMPLNTLPKEYQEMVREARARGEDITFRSTE